MTRITDNDAGRTKNVELDEPPPSSDKQIADNKSKELGYSRLLIEDVWVVGRERLWKANVKQKREGECGVLIAQKKEREHGDVGCVAGCTEVELPPWTKRMIRRFPEHYSE